MAVNLYHQGHIIGQHPIFRQRITGSQDLNFVLLPARNGHRSAGNAEIDAKGAELQLQFFPDYFGSRFNMCPQQTVVARVPIVVDEKYIHPVIAREGIVGDPDIDHRVDVSGKVQLPSSTQQVGQVRDTQAIQIQAQFVEIQCKPVKITEDLTPVKVQVEHTLLQEKGDRLFMDRARYRPFRIHKIIGSRVDVEDILQLGLQFLQGLDWIVLQVSHGLTQIVEEGENFSERNVYDRQPLIVKAEPLQGVLDHIQPEVDRIHDVEKRQFGKIEYRSQIR